MLARGNENRDIKIWEVSIATELLSLLPRDVYDRHWNICTVFSPDGRLLASGNDVGGMTLFEVLPSGQELCAVAATRPIPSPARSGGGASGWGRKEGGGPPSRTWSEGWPFLPTGAASS